MYFKLIATRSVLHQFSFVCVLLASAQLSQANSDYVATWGPSIGSTAPMLAALDQDGNQQDLESLQGANGLLFVFNRSVDW